MVRRITVLLTVAALALVGVSPSHAATKKKPKPDIKGSYSVTLYPDPTISVTNLLTDGCNGLSSKGKDYHSFVVPAAGRLVVHLVSPDPTGRGATDWDLWIMGSDGDTIDKSNGSTSDEQTTTKFTKKTPLTIEVCNLNGEPTGTVTYDFKYA